MFIKMVDCCHRVLLSQMYACPLASDEGRMDRTQIIVQLSLSLEVLPLVRIMDCGHNNAILKHKQQQ